MKHKIGYLSTEYTRSVFFIGMSNRNLSAICYVPKVSSYNTGSNKLTNHNSYFLSSMNVQWMLIHIIRLEAEKNPRLIYHRPQSLRVAFSARLIYLLGFIFGSYSGYLSCSMQYTTHFRHNKMYYWSSDQTLRILQKHEDIYKCRLESVVIFLQWLCNRYYNDHICLY